jgi:FkbM family methyltransferase
MRPALRRLVWNTVRDRLPAGIAYPLMLARSKRHSPHLFAEMRRLVRPGELALDVGAHVGVYSWFYARCGARVIAFEPHPGNFRRLARLRRFGIDAREVALGDTAGTLDFRIRHEGGAEASESGSLTREFDAAKTTRYAVKSATLDGLGLHNIGFVKIDVEGAEARVIAGGRNTLAAQKPNLMLEIQADIVGRDAFASTIETLLGLGYDCRYTTLERSGPYAEFDLERDQFAPLAEGRIRDFANNFLFVPR